MKKLYLVLIVLLFCAAANAEQTATLVHNGSPKVFYGTDAFRTACDSAVSGDVITLSSGRFSANYNIRKNVTVRGCGWKGAGKTEIYERISVRIPTADTVSHLCLEGIKFNAINIDDTLLHNPSFAKCWIGTLTLYNVFNGTISNCHIDNVSRYYGDKRYQLTFVNCIVNSSDVPNLSFINCIVGGISTNYGNVYINCIMTSDYNDLNQESTAINCVYFGGHNNFFSQCFGSNNSVVTSKDILFKNYFRMDGSGFRFDDGTTDDAFELRPEIQAQYLGNDGTQIGIYGGLRPFTSELSYPIIIDLQVAPTSSADGKLDVNIEVTNAE